MTRILELLVFRSAQRSAELKRNPQGAWRANFLAMQPDEADSYGRNAFLLEIRASALTARVQSGQTGVSRTASTRSDFK